jgi:hypothetical protein
MTNFYISNVMAVLVTAIHALPQQRCRLQQIPLQRLAEAMRAAAAQRVER